jgi:TolB protein
MNKSTVRIIAIAIVIALIALVAISLAGNSNAGTAANGPVVFARDPGTGADSDLFIVDPSAGAGAEMRLTSHRSFEWDPAISPDGTQVAFTRETRGDEGIRQSIYLMDIDGTNLKLVTRSGGQPSWAPSGNRIVFTSFRGDPKGFASDLYSIKPDRSGLRRLTSNGDVQDFSPDWSPDGASIAFTRVKRGDFSIRVMPASGGRAGLLTTNPNGLTDGNPSWSPDGLKIAFQREVDVEEFVMEIFSVEVGTGVATRLTNNQGDDQSPDWSPDGSRIVYTSGLAGNGAVWTMAADGSEPLQVTDPTGVAFDYYPTWGRALP